LFRNAAAQFVYVRTYSHWLETLGRRETWEETVERYMQFIISERGSLVPPKVLRKIKEKILAFEVMPSMRALWAAGPAAKYDNTTMYNCSYSHIEDVESFSEALYILMCGTGDGYSVMKQYINNDKLPVIPKIDQYDKELVVVDDSRAGWANSVKSLMSRLYTGKDVEFDYSQLRPKGARLNTMGGRSSGPEPLINLHSFIRNTFLDSQGRKLTTLECSDIRNQIAESVVVGGVRRSSQIAFSDLDDELMTKAKQWPFHPRRYMANHSALYNIKPSAVDFLKEWSLLASSGTGERGISNMGAARKNAPKRRDASLIEGSNPCHEIILRHKQFCNLSEVVIREDDDLDSLLEKVETATWIGVIQSSFTYFPYLSKEWKENCEEERLLGVSLTGQMDNPELLTPDVLKALKAKAIKIAKHASQKMNINMPAAITTVKPSGTVSQLVDSASGLHPRYSKYYIRRYRIAATDPLFKLIRHQGIEVSRENGQEDLAEENVNTWVISFPVKAPDTSVTRDKMNAIEQLEHYKKIQQYWCEHNGSMTVYVKDDEWFEVGNWVYKNWDFISGVSFLPYDGGKYKQAPYEEITEEKYNKLVEKFKPIEYHRLKEFEQEDNTEGAQTAACTSGVCEL
jgi:ribonucleoside-triphosphate reductase